WPSKVPPCHEKSRENLPIMKITIKWRRLFHSKPCISAPRAGGLATRTGPPSALASCSTALGETVRPGQPLCPFDRTTDAGAAASLPSGPRHRVPVGAARRLSGLAGCGATEPRRPEDGIDEDERRHQQGPDDGGEDRAEGDGAQEQQARHPDNDGEDAA